MGRLNQPIQIRTFTPIKATRATQTNQPHVNGSCLFHAIWSTCENLYQVDDISHRIKRVTFMKGGENWGAAAKGG